MISLKLNSPIDVIESELEQFHFNNGGSTLLPELKKVDTQSELIIYEIVDEALKASITLRPAPDAGCNLSAYINDSDRWAWRLGVPGRSELGINTFLGASTSPRCKDFCERFIEYLRVFGHTGNNPDSQINESLDGKQLFEEDIWAWIQYQKTNHPVDEIRAEWFIRREKAYRPGILNAQVDSHKRFESIIYSDKPENIEPE